MLPETNQHQNLSIQNSLFSEEDQWLSNYHYDLPEELIAKRPVSPRHDARLMVYYQSSQKVEHHQVKDLANILPANTLVVTNETKVFPCRYFGEKITGGKAEIFFLKPTFVNSLEKEELLIFEVLLKGRGTRTLGEEFLFGKQKVKFKIHQINKNEGSFLVSAPQKNKNKNKNKIDEEDFSLSEFMGEIGFVPIPPYIRQGISDEADISDYQTAYAKNLGSVAAPTAGLHFTDEVLKKLLEKGIRQSQVTLHVGLGTFKPLTNENLSEIHQLHQETFWIDEVNQRVLKSYLSEDGLESNKLVLPVGTTTLRVLESCFDPATGIFSPPEVVEQTSIFLKPTPNLNNRPHLKALMTNFHLPKSSLLVLVSALIGRRETLKLYEIAVKEKYRFFSYGDALLILP